MKQKLLILCATLIVAGCTNLPRYTTAEPRLSIELPAGSCTSIAVFVEPVFPGKPVVDTVVDNVVGAIWSPGEATQIGFTQKYGETLAIQAPQVAMLAGLPSSVRAGFVASGQGGGFNISSRIMIPIGLYIEQNTEKLLQRVSSESIVCRESACMEQARSSGAYARFAVVRLQKMLVAESSANRLTLELEAQVDATDSRGRTSTRHVQASVRDRSITSEGLFHSDFLKVMNKTANEVSSEFALQVLAACKSS
jgi:hypothetical protein